MVIVIKTKDPEDIIGLKERLAYAVEPAADVERVDVFGDAEFRQMLQKGVNNGGGKEKLL
jgi:hypothetical protein